MYASAVLELHEMVAVPDPVMLAGLIIPHVRPPGMVSVSKTVPAKPFSAVMVIVEVCATPTFVAVEEEADIVKSWNRKIVVVEWESGLTVPVMFSV